MMISQELKWRKYPLWSVCKGRQNIEHCHLLHTDDSKEIEVCTCQSKLPLRTLQLQCIFCVCEFRSETYIYRDKKCYMVYAC